jgi:CMP-N-acetylneuraminic acid synthetase
MSVPDSNSVIALIAMKGHSSRVKRKNLRLVAGRPLYHWVVSNLLAAKRISEVVIETDSDEIEADVRANFAVRVLRRPDRLLGDDVVMNELLEFHLSELEGEHFIQSHATNPLVRPETFDAGIAAYFEGLPGHDSVFSVSRLQTRLFWKNGEAINHDPDHLIPTQNLDPVYEENSCFYVFSRASFAATGKRIGRHPAMFPTEHLESVDIDEMHQLVFAEHLLNEARACAAAGGDAIDA